MNIVRKRARPVSTIFGGVFCVCIALRRNPSTITIRAKQVIIMSIDGSSAIKVNRMMISNGCDASTPMTSCKTDDPGSRPTLSEELSRYSPGLVVVSVSLVPALSPLLVSPLPVLVLTEVDVSDDAA